MLVCIEGCIGTGKTTLAGKLANAANGITLNEHFKNNPFLSLYYNDIAAYSLHVQICFLLLQHSKLLEYNHQKLVFADFSILKTLIFSKQILNERELDLIVPLYNHLTSTVKMPDLVIYLHGSRDTVMKYIRRRRRKTDAQIREDYILQTLQTYDHFFENYDGSKLIKLNIDIFNIMDGDNIVRLLSQIKDILAL